MHNPTTKTLLCLILINNHNKQNIELQKNNSMKQHETKKCVSMLQNVKAKAKWHDVLNEIYYILKKILDDNKPFI